MSKFTKTRAVYLDRGWYSTRIVFVPSEEAYEDFVHYWKLDKDFPNRKFLYPATRGRTTYITRPDNKGTFIVVTLGPWADTGHVVNVMGVIVHETQHVLKYLWEDIGENEARGHEQEAYAAQNIFGQIVQAFMLTRRPKWPFKIEGMERG